MVIIVKKVNWTSVFLIPLTRPYALLHSQEILGVLEHTLCIPYHSGTPLYCGHHWMEFWPWPYLRGEFVLAIQEHGTQ